jgi:hypothetical protein
MSYRRRHRTAHSQYFDHAQCYLQLMTGSNCGLHDSRLIRDSSHAQLKTETTIPRHVYLALVRICLSNHTSKPSRFTMDQWLDGFKTRRSTTR